MNRPENEPAADPAEVRDLLAPRTVLASERVFHGLVWDVVRDTVELGEDRPRVREYVNHPGAVAILAIDDSGRVLLQRQYRHPVRMELWELPAGLLDVSGEPPLAAAQRELAEEADLRAGCWDLLVDWFNSPGGVNEALRCYLARDLQPVPEAELHQRVDEEQDMPSAWLPLDEARAAVLAGRLNNPATCIGILAACAARDLDWSTLRPADSPWPQHPAHTIGGVIGDRPQPAAAAEPG